jgi:hypothetical protein
VSQKAEPKSIAKEDGFLLLYDQVREKWLEHDPYMRDPDGFMGEVNLLWDEHEQELERQREEKAREIEGWFNMSWRETLRELAPRHMSVRLEDRIYNELLVKGEQFRSEKADEYEDSFELLIRLRAAQHDFDKEFGEYWDMFGTYLLETGRLTSKHTGQALTPMTVVRGMCSIIIGDDLETVRSISDPCCGTGRFMLGCAQHYRETIGKDNYIFFNQDIDFRMYVYTAMNAILHDIPSITVLGDTLANEKREAILVTPLAPGLSPWKILKENIHGVEAALLAGIEQLATQV